MKNSMSGLQLGSYALGDQEISGGSFDKLKTLGTLIAQDAKFNDLSILGDATLKQCNIVKMSVTGEANIYDSTIDFVEILGELRFYGHVTCGGIRILGEIKSEDTTCRILQFGSDTWFHSKRRKRHTLNVGTFQGETLQNFFPIQLNGKQQFKNIINSGQIDASAPITCNRFMNFGTCDIPEINAEMIYLYPSAHVRVDQLLGGVVIIDEQFDHEQWLKGVSMDVSVRDIQTQNGRGKVRVQNIEADEIVVNHMECKRISGKHIVIGANARVDYVEYIDTCEIHPDAKVKEVVKL